jgi:hypothetical protein
MTDNGLYVDAPLVRNSSLEGFTPPVGSQIQVAKASAKRRCITFIAAGPNIMQLAPDNPINNNRFIQLAPQQGPLIMDIEIYGSLIQGAWFAQSLTAPMGLAVIDTVEG